MTVRHETETDHPTECELADLALGRLDDARSSAVSAHLRSCPECRILSGRLGHGLPELPEGDLPGDADAAAPGAALAAMAAADRPEAGPEPGQLWRARDRRGGPVTLVWLRALEGAGAVVVPVSLDIELADEHTLIVPAAASPLGTALAVHVPVEATIDATFLLDRLGSVDVASDVASLRAASVAGDPVEGMSVGPNVVSPFDERIEYRQALVDRLAELAPAAGEELGHDARAQPARASAQDDWWLPAASSGRADLLMAIHQALAGTHPGARVTPRPPAAAPSEDLSAVALVAELDAFVLVASSEAPSQGQARLESARLESARLESARLESARLALQADQLLNAVCVDEAVAPFMAVVIDRRDVVEAIETPSGQLRPPRQSRPPAPIGNALVKFLDATITPFGRLAATVVEGEAIDPRALAADVSADAVRSVAGSARGYKVEGKRPGYERVTRHKASITRLVESALGDPDVDVASIMEEGE